MDVNTNPTLYKSGTISDEIFLVAMVEIDDGITTNNHFWMRSRLRQKEAVRLEWIQKRVDSANTEISGRGTYPVKACVTEMNMGYQASQPSDDTYYVIIFFAK